MNSTPLEDQVHDALHRRVDPIQHSPLTVTDVRQRARRIQRRRTMAAGAAVAAALAVAVPMGLAITGPAQRSDFPPATRTPAPTITGPVLVDPRSASEGEAPAVPLVVAGEHYRVLLDGQEYALPSPYDQLTAFRDGWIATAVINDQGERAVHVLDEGFGLTEEASPVTDLTVAHDGSRVAYAFHDGTRWIVVDNDLAGEPERTTPLPDGPVDAQVRTVGFLPDDGIVASQVDPGRTDGRQSTFVVSPDGTTEALPGLIHAVSSSPVTGTVAGLTSVDMERAETCSAVVDGLVRTGEALWETCDYSFGSFSPDGRHVVGYAASFDNASPTLTILDAASGEVALDFELVAPRNRVVGIADVVWEDDQTFLATYIDGNQQYVLRLGLDGTVERVAGPVTNDDFTLSLHLTPGRID